MYQWLEKLSNRLRNVRVLCGDWTRACTKTPLRVGAQTKSGVAAVFMDPPYGEETGRDMGLYADESGSIAGDMREWCKQNGDNPSPRIALCGYGREHAELETLGWDAWSWRTSGGYGNFGQDGESKRRAETVWFSPHCLPPATKEQGRNAAEVTGAQREQEEREEPAGQLSMF